MYTVEPPFPWRWLTSIAGPLVPVQGICCVSPQHSIACLPLGTTVSGTTSPVFHHDWTSVVGYNVVEDMHEVLKTNGTYYYCLASDICVDLSCLPSTFPSTEHSLASPPLPLRLQHLHYLASHISVRYHAEDCLLSHKHRREDRLRLSYSRLPQQIS